MREAHQVAGPATKPTWEKGGDMKISPLLAGLMAGVVGIAGAALYKWVDERGVTHYSESPPPARPSTRMEDPPRIPPPRPPPAVDPAPPTRPHPAAPAAGQSPPVAPTTVEARRAPPLSGRHVATERTWTHYVMDGDVLSGRIGLTVVGAPTLEGRVWIRVEFMVPIINTRDPGTLTNPSPPLQTILVPERSLLALHAGERVSVESPNLQHLRCVAYPAAIEVFRDEQGGEPLEVIPQRIYARIDGGRVRSATDLAAALALRQDCAP
jgi:hypothetical protein